jgi:hypothetical protein
MHCQHDWPQGDAAVLRREPLGAVDGVAAALLGFVRKASGRPRVAA